MKSTTIRTFQTVHTWTGLLAGFALFVAFYAGALTVFHDEIATWQTPPWRSALDAGIPTRTLIDRLVTQHVDARDDFGIVLPTDDAHAAYAYWHAGDGEQFATVSQMASPRNERSRGELGQFIYDLHDSLGIPVVGLYLMGIVSVLYGLALVSGVVLHLPHLLGDLFAMRVGHNLKRLWQDAHNAIGVLSLPFHLIFAVTGSILCLFTITLAALNTIAFDGKLLGAFQQAIATAPIIVAAHVPAPMLPVEALIARAHAAAMTGNVTSFDPVYLHYLHYGDRSAIIEVLGVSQHTLGTYGSVALSAVDGRVLNTTVGSKHTINGITNAAIYGLHFGNFGGATVRWLYFAMGLAGAFLFYSGNLLWIESRRKRRHVDQPKRTRVMARATLGVFIGTPLGISGAFGATLLAENYAINAALAQQLSYYGLFFSACAYAFARSIPRAAVELLCATAALTIAVALADLLANAAAWTQPWTPASTSVLGVDLTGIALGLIFARLARASGRRAQHGDRHSVWALPASMEKPTPG